LQPIEDLVELSFSVESDAFGEQKVHDLIPDGRNIAVTDDNKLEYIQKYASFPLLPFVPSPSLTSPLSSLQDGQLPTLRLGL